MIYDQFKYYGYRMLRSLASSKTGCGAEGGTIRKAAFLIVPPYRNRLKLWQTWFLLAYVCPSRSDKMPKYLEYCRLERLICRRIPPEVLNKANGGPKLKPPKLCPEGTGVENPRWAKFRVRPILH